MTVLDCEGILAGRTCCIIFVANTAQDLVLQTSIIDQTEPFFAVLTEQIVASQVRRTVLDA